MSRATVRIEFEGAPRNETDDVLEVEVGDSISGWVEVTATEQLKLNGINIQVGFRAHGRGDEDRVHQRISGCSATQLEAGQPERLPFECSLPDEGPISWNGKVVKVTWEVLVHLDIPWAVDQYESRPFIVRPRRFFDEEVKDDD